MLGLGKIAFLEGFGYLLLSWALIQSNIWQQNLKQCWFDTESNGVELKYISLRHTFHFAGGKIGTAQLDYETKKCTEYGVEESCCTEVSDYFR